MPCPHDNLPLLATGRLSGFAKWRAERHVKSCPDCTAELAQLSSLSGQLRALTLSEPSADLDERVLTFRPEKKRQAPSARPEKRSLRGLLLALPFIMAVLAMGAATFFILSTAHDQCWVSELKIVWKAPTGDAKEEARSLDLQIDALCTERAVQSILPSFDGQGRVRQVEISHRIEGDREVARRVFQTWIDRIVSEGKKNGHGWSAEVSRSPYFDRVHALDIVRGNYPTGQTLSAMLPVALFYSAFTGLTIGFFISLAIWIFRMGGFGALIVGAIVGLFAATIISAFQKNYYAADGQMDARLPNIVALAQSEEMQRDLRHDKIYTLSVDILPGTDTVRFRATGLYANYTAATVNLWMKRVQDRSLKDWTAREHPSRVDEMNPPVRISSEAVTPDRITQPNRRGTMALGLALGCAFGGFFGFAHRRDSQTNERERTPRKATSVPFLLLIPILMPALMMLCGVVFVLNPLQQKDFRTTLEITWKKKPIDVYEDQKMLVTEFNSLKSADLTQSTWPSKNLYDEIESITLRQNIVGNDRETAKRELQNWIDRIVSKEKEKYTPWKVKYSSDSDSNSGQRFEDRKRMLSPTLMFTGLLGAALGIAISLTIFTLRSGGILLILWLTALGAFLGFLPTIPKMQPESTPFRAQGMMYFTSGVDDTDYLSKLAHSPKVMQGLQDKEREEIYFLKTMKNPYSLHFYAGGKNSRKTTDTVNAWMGRVAREYFKTWKGRDNRPGKSERTPNLVVADAKAPPETGGLGSQGSIAVGTIFGAILGCLIVVIRRPVPQREIFKRIVGWTVLGMAIGSCLGKVFSLFLLNFPEFRPEESKHLLIGFCLGGILGFIVGLIRRRDEKSRVNSPERNHRSDHSAGENPMRIPFSIVVGIAIGSSLAMLVSLFQAPVYEASGKALVKTPGALTRMVELANRGIPKNVMERLQREKSRVFVPEVSVEPIEKTPFLRFHATADDPDLVAQAVNETLRETILVGEKNGIQANVIDEAIVPSQPIGPNKPGSIVFGAGVGGLLGMCFGILRRR